MIGGEKSAAEVGHAAVGREASVEDDKAGQILIETAEAVGGPGSHTGPTEEGMPGVDSVDRVGMIGREGRHRPDDAKIVRAACEVGEEVADGDSAFAVSLEFPGTGHEVALGVEDGRVRLELRLLPVLLVQPGLGIKGVDLGDTAVHEEEDHALGFGRMMDGLGFDASARSGRGDLVRHRLIVEHGRKRKSSESHGGFAQEMAAGNGW